ncbi:Heterogeneous nuclear ribonucleoprotein 1 [Linum grandiflorum]
MELGKLFIGGISWDTNEDRLREYFQAFGDVVEAVIMKDRSTGRARGFGFVVFADPAVAERVVMQKHLIDGRNVEAKKAVPREDQSTLTRSNNSSIQGSPGPTRTKKIFVGGLASTVTESDFKKYFDQFGTITDVVVMYDHNTQRPRGFGFITFDTEEAVDKVLYRTFHELSGKMVEVKRAVPKDLSSSAGSTRSPLAGYNYGMNRINSFLNGYPQAHNPNSAVGSGLRMDGRFSPVTANRGSYSPFNTGYGSGLGFEQSMSPSYGGNSNLTSNMGFGRLSPYSGNSSRYGSPIGYGTGNGGNNSVLSSVPRTLWSNDSIQNNSNSNGQNGFLSTGGWNSGLGSFGSSGALWDSSTNMGQGSGAGSASYNNGSGEFSIGLGGSGYGRTSGASFAPVPSRAAQNGGYDRAYADIYENGGSLYGDSSWQSSTSGLFDFGLGNSASDVITKNTAAYGGGYGIADTQPDRGKCLPFHTLLLHS